MLLGICVSYPCVVYVHAVCLQKLSGLKCEQLLSSAQVLPSECVSGLVELAGNPSTSPTLTSSIISLLSQLGTEDLFILYTHFSTSNGPSPECSGILNSSLLVNENFVFSQKCEIPEKSQILVFM